jgi:Fur family iron response transcriptional regulator
MLRNPSTIDDTARLLLSERLQQHGIQVTPQRLDIAGVLFVVEQHLSADQVLERVNRKGGAVSKATVYNTLGLFAERGLVRELRVDAARVFYDSNPRPHCHFYNVDDGTLTDLDVPAELASVLPQAPEGTFTESLDVIIRIRNQQTATADEAISENFRL